MIPGKADLASGHRCEKKPGSTRGGLELPELPTVSVCLSPVPGKIDNDRIMLMCGGAAG